MPDCDKFKMHFSDYTDGELSPTQRKWLEEHFEECLECAETVRQMKIIQQSLRNLPSYKTSPDFERRLQEQIFGQSSRSTIPIQPWNNWKLPAMGSALVLATVGLFLVFNPSDNGQQIYRNQSSTISPAATRFPGTKSGNIAAQPNSAGSSTLISDSLRDDTTQIDPQGLQLVGDQK